MLDLERITEVANKINLLPLKFFVITVAGTNGKGSTVAILDSILRQKNLRVGRYMSPYLYAYNEQISVNGLDVSNQELCEVFEYIEKSRGSVVLTEFEFCTLAALIIFAKSNIDIAILEVGLGGRLDATNIVDADIAVITSVDIDHTAWLGHTREEIAKEKSGIMRSNKPVIFGEENIPLSLKNHAKNLSACLYSQGVNFGFKKNIDTQDSQNTWDWYCEEIKLLNLPCPSHLLIQNASTALMALRLLGQVSEYLKISEENIREGLKQVYLSGRLESVLIDNQIDNQYEIILDVAHNPHAARVLAERLEVKKNTGKTYAVFSVLADKDLPGIVRSMKNYIHEWHIAPLKTERAMNLLDLKKGMKEAGAAAYFEYETIAEAYMKLKERLKERLGAEDRIIVFGSFYCVREVSACI